MAFDEKAYDEFAKRMETKYPEMYVGTDETCYGYGGFCVGAGWWPIVESLSDTIQHYLNWRNREEETVPQVQVRQIKEKFGGLRFYYDGGDERINGMVRMAEEWAAHTCEVCGSPGTIRYEGWHRTLCDTHEAEYKKQMKELNHE